MRFSSLRAEESEKPELVTGTLPLVAAAETRLDFGNPTEVLRTVSTRSSIEISPMELKDGESTTVRGAALNIEKGPCFLVTRWQDMVR
jgi:hypothetical protein